MIKRILRNRSFERTFPLVDQGLFSGTNFLYGILLPFYLGVDGFGRYAYFVLIYNLFVVLWESAIISPWVYAINDAKSSDDESEPTPPFLLFSLCLSLPFTGFAAFYLDLT